MQLPQVLAVSDEKGEYRLFPLPIGVYAVEYSLSGFQTFRREGIQLTVGFTAKVDVQLKVGSLSESVTVSGAAPVVDVTSSGSSTQLTRETLELIPTGRTGFQSVLAQAPGARSIVDVGGDQFNSNPTFHAFGQEGESWQVYEGIVTNVPKNTSQSGVYMNYAAFEEAKVQTLGNDAEVPSRGVAISAVAKSGGNENHGSVLYAYENHTLQGDNIDATLAAQGITQGLTLHRRDEVGGDLGGKIKPNKVWFYGGARNRYQLGDTLGCFQPGGVTPCDDLQQQVFENGKLTYQLSPSNKIIGFAQFEQKINDGGASRLVSYEARGGQRLYQRSFKGEWQALKGNSLVFSVVAGASGFNSNTVFHSDQVSRIDLVTGVTTGTTSNSGEYNHELRRQLRGNMSWYKPGWIGGNHELKSGFEYHESNANRGNTQRGVSGNYQLQYRSTVPNQLVAFNYPVDPNIHTRYIAWYLQDSWTMARKLTLNLGLRYAYDNGFDGGGCRVAADAPSDVAYPAQCFDPIQMNVWNSFIGRARAAYDLSGDGRTVIKGGWGRFMRPRGTDDVLTVSRNVKAQTVYKWHDLNNDLAYQPGEVNLSLSGLDFVSQTLMGITGALSGGVPNPSETQPYTDEYSLQFERELRPNLAVRVTTAYSRAMNQERLANNFRPYAAFNIPITNLDPGPDGKLGTADDTGQSITYYDYPASLAGVAFQQGTIVNDPKMNQTYKTIEVAVTKRLANNWQFMASYSYTKKHIPLVTNAGGGNSPLFNTQDPNSEIFAADDTPEKTGRLSASYLFKWGILASMSFDSLSGAPLARTVSFANGARVGTLTLRVEPIGSSYLPTLNLMNLRAEKRLALGKGGKTGKQLSLQFNLYNATNISSATTIATTSGGTYGLITAIVPARIGEVVAKFTF